VVLADRIRQFPAYEWMQPNVYKMNCFASAHTAHVSLCRQPNRSSDRVNAYDGPKRDGASNQTYAERPRLQPLHATCNSEKIRETTTAPDLVLFPYCILVFLFEVFKPSRGIRQGDPISPYLFLLCAEGLTCMLKNTGPQYIARGIRISLRTPWVSHLMFADDCVVCGQANKRSADRIASILDLYNKISGQLVNKQKSGVLFSANCDQEGKQEVLQSLGIRSEVLGEKYLGLPTAAGNGVIKSYADCIRNFVYGWSEKKLSCAGREVLIKANLQAVPTYPMSCFKLSAHVCKKMQTYISNFWWGSAVDSHKIHWQSWSKLTMPKKSGGMGFRDLPLFNKAMLAKQGWRLMTRPNSLCARIIKGKYFPNGDFLKANKRKQSSEIWKAVLFGREALWQGLIKRVGPGSSISIWEDNWIPSLRQLKPTVHLEGVQVQSVDEL
jgi:hypothetical protein